MNRKLLIGTVVFILIAVGGFVFLGGQKQNIPTTEDSLMKKDSGDAIGEKRTVEGYSGNVLAGNASPYLEFNKTDYDKALTSGKIVFLDFFANWCPICRAEAPELKAGFDSLTSDKLIGFRVNYNDSDTDQDEKNLAEQFGITYQHTKVILQNGKQVVKSGDSWTKEEFLKQMNALGAQ